MTGAPTGRAERGAARIPGLYGIFRTSDGWLAVVGVGAALRPRLFELLGRPELTEQFPQLLYWQEEKAALFPLLDEAFSQRTTAEWCEALGAAGIRYAPVRDHAEVVADPGAWDNEYLRRVDVDGEEVVIVASPVRFSATPADPKGSVPELGQQTEEVLAEVGYGWDDIAALRDAGAI